MSQFATKKSISTNSLKMTAGGLESANKHIFRALLSLASAALLIRVMGMVNQFVVSSHYGAGATMDAYFMPIQQTFKRLPTLAILLIYLLWVLTGIGISPLAPGAFLIAWVSFLDYAAIAVLTINVLTTRQRIIKLIDTFMLLSAFVALYGIYAYFTRQTGGQDEIIPSIYRIGSLFGRTGSQVLAMLLSMAIPLGLYRTFTSHGL